MLAGIQCTLYLPLPKAVEWDRPDWSSSGEIVGILEEEPVDLLSSAHQPHFDLANMLDDDGSVRRFASQWGPLNVSNVIKVGSYWPSLIVETNAVIEKLLLKHPDSANYFIEAKAFILGRRDVLRCAWQGDKQAQETLQQSVAENAGSVWKFQHGRIEIPLRDLWTGICVLFLRDWESQRIGICGNPDCPVRYCFKKKADQKFCERGPCLNYGRKKIKRDWWQAHGEAWRASRKNKGRKRR